MVFHYHVIYIYQLLSPNITDKPLGLTVSKFNQIILKVRILEAYCKEISH
jgi:hypothetical protein